MNAGISGGKLKWAKSILGTIPSSSTSTRSPFLILEKSTLFILLWPGRIKLSYLAARTIALTSSPGISEAKAINSPADRSSIFSITS